MRKIVPTPISDSISMRPFSFSMPVLTTSMPTPRPETLDTSSLVEKPGRKTRCRLWFASRRLAASASISPFSSALRRSDFGVHAAAVVADRRSRCGRLPGVAVRRTVLRAGLPAAMRSLGRLDAVIDRVAHEVDERIGEIVDHRAVELGVLAFEDELDFLAERAREVARHARIFLEQPPDRLHARLHDRALEVGDDEVELVHRLVEVAQHVGVGAARDDVVAQAVQAVLREAELARERQHLVEARSVDADRRVARRTATRSVVRRPDRHFFARQDRRSRGVRRACASRGGAVGGGCVIESRKLSSRARRPRRRAPAASAASRRRRAALRRRCGAVRRGRGRGFAR